MLNFGQSAIFSFGLTAIMLLASKGIAAGEWVWGKGLGGFSIFWKNILSRSVNHEKIWLHPSVIHNLTLIYLLMHMICVYSSMGHNSVFGKKKA